MGTRCLTVLHDNHEDREIVVMYRQMDGYPEGHGADLAEFLSGGEIINGISVADRGKLTFNGLECLAAQVVAHFKTDVGSIYLMPAGTRDVWEDYIYHVRGEVGEEPTIEIEGVAEAQPASELLRKIKSGELKELEEE
jgi:hypothetical protein